MRVRAFGAGLCLAAVAACGGTPSEPSPPAPVVAGTYHLDLGFDQLTAAQAHSTGVVTLTPTSPGSSTLSGTATMTTTVEGDVSQQAGEVFSAAMSPGGSVTFTIGSPDGVITWTFAGTVSGDSIHGRHRLSDGMFPIDGDFAGARTGSGVPAFSTAASETPAETAAELRSLIGVIERLRSR
jgi:hypothetical protein